MIASVVRWAVVLGAVFLLAACAARTGGITPSGLRALMETASRAVAGIDDLPVPDLLPAIQFLPNDFITEVVFGDNRDNATGQALAAYHISSRTILLNDSWAGETFVDQSVLMHELVHHMQRMAGKEYICPGLSERTAYEAQRIFLESHGLDMFEVMEISKLFYMIVTNCAFPEVR